MSLRPPSNLSGLRATESPDQVFRHEILAEQASSLGAAGRRVECALEALRAHDEGRSPAADRKELLSRAAYAVWCFFVQRELAGLRGQQDVIRHYRISREVLNNVGRVCK